MRKHLYVDNVDLATYGVYINGDGIFTAPEKVHEWFEVPNRDGAVLGLERRLRNIRVSYECFIYTNFDANVQALRNFLLSRDGLVRIADDYHTDEFRMGVYSGGLAPKVTPILDAGSFTLTFECQPQRWLVSGETVVGRDFGYNSSSSYDYLTINNPTLFTSKPLIKVEVNHSRPSSAAHMLYWSSSATDPTISINLPSDYDFVYIDCDTMTIYNGDANLAPYVMMQEQNASIYGVDYPVCPPGQIRISPGFSSIISRVEVTPRWWRV